MRIQIYIIVTVLIVFQKPASEAVSLPSPANVSIQCDSYGVEVRWEYPDLSQDVQFQVEVKDDLKKNSITQTRNLHLNISSMMFNASYNRYCVTVTAVRGGEESKPTISDVFSYNELSATNFKCYLDFPEVELSPKDGKLHVQFANPLQLYRNSPALRDLTADLKYCIETVQEESNKFCKTCEMTQNTCETSIGFSEHRGEYCINLTGKIRQRNFNDKSSCFTGDIRSYPSITVYLYPVLGVILTLLFITGIIMLLVTKYNTTIKEKASSMFPDSLRINLLSRTPLYIPDQDQVDSDVHIEPVRSTEEQNLNALSDNKTGYSDAKNMGSGDSEATSPYEGNDFVHKPYNESEGYDCPHAPKQEMSPGDMVDGYGPKLLLDV